MGCGQSNENVERRMIDLESECLALSGLNIAETTCSFVFIDLPEGPFRVRTITTGSKDKKTLLLMHGFGIASCMFGPILAQLAKTYRIVLFDNLSFGLNTRLEESQALESSEEAEKWIETMLVSTVEALDLPEKFYLAGWSHGGWQAAVLASQIPKRIESVFLISPAGTETYDEATYDPYQQLDSSKPYQMASKETVAYIENLHKFKGPIYGEDLQKQSYWARKGNARGIAEAIFKPMMEHTALSNDLVEKMLEYNSYMIMSPSVIDTASQLVHKYIGVAMHSLKAQDRLGNPEASFPIAVAVGDRDVFTTEGAEDVLGMLKEREGSNSSSKYRIYVVKNSSHAMVWDQPVLLAKTIVSHFENQVGEVWQIRHKGEYVPSRNWRDSNALPTPKAIFKPKFF